MRILLATDAWEPQVNGVVRTLTRIVAELRDLGDEVEVISPDQFPSFPVEFASVNNTGNRFLPGTYSCQEQFYCVVYWGPEE